jgi:SAM-dependent methyltransferase
LLPGTAPPAPLGSLPGEGEEGGARSRPQEAKDYQQHLHLSACHLHDLSAADVRCFIIIIRCTAKETNLEENSIDIAFICDVYHHLEYPRTFMRSLLKAMKPGGHVVLIDFHRIPEK